MSRYLGDEMWTVTVTCKVWPDREDAEPIADAIYHALAPIIGESRGERFYIDVSIPELTRED